MKHIKKLKIVLVCMLIPLSLPSLTGQETVVEYSATSAIIANPERGWYDQYTTHSGSSSLGTEYKPLKTEELLANREEDNITLILRLFMLHPFLEETQVSADYINKMQADFDTIRAAGIKCIIRFAYSLSQSAEVWDATPDKVFSHIASMGDVLYNNSDVIAGVQAGFIGAWGEWYYTKNFAGQGYLPDATDQQNRITLVEGLLSVMPDHVVVEGRTPAIMKNLAKTDDPISEEEAFDGSYKSRIGHHNDCFVASASDYGTYTNLEADLAYLNQSTKYTITGGETCDGSNIYSDCANSVDRLSTLHWTYLNRGYNKSVFTKWLDQGCYGEVDLSLGYRIRLISSTLDNSADQGTPMNLSFRFVNEGYAAPTQFKALQVVLTHTQTGDKVILDYTGTNQDIRFWLPGEILSEGSVEIPADLPDGNYSLAIRFPDKDPVLAQNPAYSIQLANAGVWDHINGTNLLNHIVSIGAGGLGALPTAPSGLDATTISESQIDLSWTDNSDDESGFELMRAEGDGIAWEQVVILDPDMQAYSDNNLTKGRYYHYMIRSINNYGFSAWSDTATAPTLGVYTEPYRAEKIKLFPNPFLEGSLTVRFPDNTEKHIVVSNLVGARIMEITTTNSTLELAHEMFSPGVYSVSCYQGSSMSTSRLIVL